MADVYFWWMEIHYTTATSFWNFLAQEKFEIPIESWLGGILGGIGDILDGIGECQPDTHKYKYRNI